MLACAVLGGFAWQPLSAAGLVLDDMAIHAARPENIVQHDVELESPLDAKRWEPALKGPTHHSTSSVSGRGIEEARFNWYAFAKPGAAPNRTVTVVMRHPSQARVDFQLGQSVYFLSSAQRLAEGKPSPAPEQLSHLVAYRIKGVVDGLAQNAESEVLLGSAKVRARLKRPVLLCLPVREWHHDDYTPVKDADFCMVVYETDPYGPSDELRIGTLDQFGLNSLRLTQAELVGVSAKTVVVK